MMKTKDIFEKFANPVEEYGWVKVVLSEEEFREDAFIKALIQAVKYGGLTDINELDLSHTRLGDAGLIALAMAAEAGHLIALKVLKLGSTSVGDGGVIALAAAAGHLSALEQLDLGYTGVGDRGLIALATAARAGHFSTLEQLDIAATKVGDGGVIALAAAAGHLTALDQLVFGYTGVGDGGLIALATAARAGHLISLVLLDLSNTQVGDTGLMALATAAGAGHLISLVLLDLSNTQVGDTGLMALATAAGAGHLIALKWLNLSDTTIGDGGLSAFATAASNLPNLITLDINDTQIRLVDSATLESGDATEIFRAVLHGEALPVARICFLGTARVGKTGLYIRCFLDRLDLNRSAEDSTKDIDLIRAEACDWKPEIDGKRIEPRVPQRPAGRRLADRPEIDGRRIEPRVWDFGGQLVLHGLHETFLGDDGRTVYVLVLSANSVPGRNRDGGEERGNAIPYWLRMVHHFGGSTAPVVVAITQCDRPPLLDRPIDQPFPPFKDPLKKLTPDALSEAYQIAVTDCVDNLSATNPEFAIEPLRKAINAAVATRDGIRTQKVSKGLLEVRKIVEKNLPACSLVPMADYRRWCVEAVEAVVEEKETMDVSRQDAIRGILHHMGCLFYFGESKRDASDRQGDLAPGHKGFLVRERDTILGEFIVNPAWLKHAAYAVFKESKDTDRAGWLPRELVRRKANEAVVDGIAAHPDGGKFVEAYLKLVELCFYDEARGEYLFPRGLSARQPSVGRDWQDRAFLSWNFVPESAFHRFMVRMHKRDGCVLCDAQGFSEHGRHWIGVTLLQCTIVVSADVDEGLIEMRFDPASEPAQRAKAFVYLRELFAGELIGKEPVEDRGPGSKPTEAQREVDEFLKFVATIPEAAWVGLDDAAGYLGIATESLKRALRPDKTGVKLDLRVSENLGRTFHGHIWRKRGKELQFWKGTLR